MTDPETSRHIEIKDGDQTIAAAEVPPGSRTSLVNAVMDLPEVQASARLEATVPLGDGESLERLRERTEDTATRPAGSTALVDADIPSPGKAGPADHRPSAAR